MKLKNSALKFHDAGLALEARELRSPQRAASEASGSSLGWGWDWDAREHCQPYQKNIQQCHPSSHQERDHETWQQGGPEAGEYFLCMRPTGHLRGEPRLDALQPHCFSSITPKKDVQIPLVAQSILLTASSSFLEEMI
jgi:hypothetical protein